MADYPCLVHCAALPAVEISSVRSTGADEYVALKLKPGVTSSVDLTAVVLVALGWTKEIAPGTILAPGETLTVLCDRTGADTRLVQDWGPATPKLRDTGGSVVLRTAQSQVIDTFSW